MCIGGGGDTKIDETPDQIAAANVAAGRYDYYEDTLRDVEDWYIQDQTQLNDEKHHNKLSSMIGAEYGAIGQEMSADASKQLTTQLNPASGNFKASLSDMSNTLASKQADDTNRAQVQQQDAYLQGLQNVTSMGEGKAIEAQSSLTDIAEQSAANARQTQLIDQDNRANNQGAVAFGVGAASRAAWGNDEES